MGNDEDGRPGIFFGNVMHCAVDTPGKSVQSLAAKRDEVVAVGVGGVFAVRASLFGSQVEL